MSLHASTTLTITRDMRILGVTIPKGLAILARPLATLPNTPDCDPGTTNGAIVNAINVGVGNIVHILMGVGIAVSVLGIIAGGLMRATSFGNERRIAMSNTAITCAVVGLIIVILGATIGNAIPAWFGAGDVTACEIQNGQ
jgi:hypothetical protein